MMKSIMTAWAVLILAAGGAQADSVKVDVKKTASCGCCQAWVNHLKRSGFEVATENMAFGALARFKRNHGIGAEHQSCHTGRVAGYVIEGHVPAREVARLLKEQPDAIGLSVPGMPIGSPGMEVGTARDAYSVLLLKKDGSTEVFASYDAKP
ncbi:MAG: DUF411 domain-containing protein [Hyphomicrobiaceae bacterium]